MVNRLIVLELEESIVLSYELMDAGGSLMLIVSCSVASGMRVIRLVRQWVDVELEAQIWLREILDSTNHSDWFLYSHPCNLSNARPLNTARVLVITITTV